jgi:6-phosphogluconolactonase
MVAASKTGYQSPVCVLFFFSRGKAAMTELATLIVGTYTDSLPHVAAKGTGISVLRIDGGSGEITPVSTFSGLKNPTYLALSPDGGKLYAVEELDEKDGAAAAALCFDVKIGNISAEATMTVKGDAPCHVAVDNDGRRLFVGNYGSGSFVAYALGPDGLPTGEQIEVQRRGSGPNPDRQQGPHVHQVVPTPDGRHVLICDAGTDEIARHSIAGCLIDPKPDHVTKAASGSLPRHMVFSRDGAHVFVLHELACTIASYAYGESGLELLGEASTLPGDFGGQSACAAIRLHPNGRFLYASNRGHDSIVAYAVDDGGLLTPIGWYATLGRTPRDFAVDPSGSYLVAANQDSHSLAVFRIDRQTGALEAIGETYEIGSPACVLFAGP